jgi:2-succinyl-6-hydroxy-2,4-cyclohexadiene-1-carboxylate synthase
MPKLYRFHYVILGQTDKPKILFLHGFMGSISDWKGVSDLMSPDYRCLILDLPGHGATQVRKNTGYDFTTCAKGIKELLKEINFYPVNLVGYSLGGRIALYMTVVWPDLINRVVLESASPGILGKKDRLDRVQKDTLLAEQLKREWPDFVNNWYQQPLFKGISKSIHFRKMITNKKHNNPDELALALRGMSQGIQPSLWHRLKDVKTRVLLLTGALDTKYMHITEKMEKKLPYCTRHVFPDCSHNIHIQCPDRYNTELRNFLLHV